MEPHAAQDRLSFVCNWKHMHCEAKSKRGKEVKKPPKPRKAHRTLYLPLLRSGVSYFGPGQVRGHSGEPESIY